MSGKVMRLLVNNIGKERTVLGPGRPSAAGPRWDRRLNTFTHASLRACGAQIGGSVWKQGK